MIELGKINKLEVLRETSVGVFLGDDDDEVLLPIRYVLPELEVGDEIEVFVYNDSEDRMVAVTDKPKIEVDEFGVLEVKDVNKFGVFMDWGMIKDLMVPFREQDDDMEVGERFLVYCYLDNRTDRLVGTCKLGKFLNNVHIGLEELEAVELIIWKRTDLGYKVIINEEYEGLIFHSEIHQKIEIGERLVGYVKEIREDKKIDITLQKQGYKNVIDDNANTVLEEIKKNDGFLALHDKSHPDEIKFQLKMSKKNFKKAIGTLYKQKLIVIEDSGLRLV